MLRKLLRRLSRRLIREERQKSYDAGLDKGYELGLMMSEMKRTNRGFIIGGSRVDREIEEILKERGG